MGTETYNAPFCPLPWQEAPWKDLSQTLLLTGSAGGGKSALAAEKLHAYCKKYPGVRAAVFRKAREWVRDTAGESLRKAIGDDDGVTFYKSEGRWIYTNGSQILSRGMADENQRQSVRSSEFDYVWMEEATQFTESDYNEIGARMRGKAAPWRQIALTTNPDSPTHWIYRRLISGKEAAVYYSGVIDNPHTPLDYAERLNELTGVLRQRLVEGRWVQAEGAIYTDWNPDRHLIPQREVPKDAKRIISIDFGFRHPMVVQWWATDWDERMVLYREIYETGRLVEDVAREARSLSAGERISKIICDHDAEGRATWERHFRKPTTPARKDVLRGIEKVQSRLRLRGTKPGLMIMQNTLVRVDQGLKEGGHPYCTAHEIPGYQYDQAPDGKPLKEQPRKLEDDGCDCMRYAVMHEDDDEGRAIKMPRRRMNA